LEDQDKTRREAHRRILSNLHINGKRFRVTSPDGAKPITIVMPEDSVETILLSAEMNLGETNVAVVWRDEVVVFQVSLFEE
jgi:hypothetical protein